MPAGTPVFHTGFQAEIPPSQTCFQKDGDPGGTRTPYLQIRNLSLYPDELRDHAPYMPQFTGNCQMRAVIRSASCPLLPPTQIGVSHTMAAGAKPCSQRGILIGKKYTVAAMHALA